MAGIMNSMGDFFSNMKRRGAEIAQAGADKAKTAYDGLRGQAAPGADESFVRNAQNASKVGMEGANGEGLRSSATSEAARAADPRGYTGPSKGQMLQTAANYTPRGLAGYAAKAGRLVGPAAAIPEVYNAGENIAAGENPLKSIGRASLRTGGAMLGGAIGAAGGTLAAPGVGTLAGGVAGGVAGYNLADKASDALFGPAKTSGPAAAAAAPAPASTALPNGQPEIKGGGSLSEQPVATGGSDGLVDLTDGNRARPGVLTDSNIGVPVEGQGAFKVGNQPAQAIKTAPQENSVNAQAYNRAHGLGGAATLGKPNGVFGEIAAGSALRAKDVAAQREQGVASQNAKLGVEQRGQNLQYENNVAMRNLEAARLTHTMDNEQETRIGKRNEAYVRGKNPAVTESLVPGSKAQQDYEAKVKQEHAELTDMIDHTQSLTGKSVGKLSDPQHSLLLKANDLRTRLDTYRTTAPSFFQDFVGNKRFDSKNLYSYLPARDDAGKVKPAIPETFGYSVEMGNGNKVKVYSLVNKDGSTGFNFTGPNKPVDADAMELMAPAIKAAQAKAGKK